MEILIKSNKPEFIKELADAFSSGCYIENLREDILIESTDVIVETDKDLIIINIERK